MSRHVHDADEAVNIGSVERDGSNPFLNIELLVQTAIDVGAEACHPGYGYLSENPQFAERLQQAGIILIGPNVAAMSTLGDKRAAKEYLRQHGPEIPLVPGYAGSSQSVQDLEAAAAQIGYPVILKASAGGGGKGMRIIREPRQLGVELQRAQSEAQRSFGSRDCILEKYVESSKHVEIQILGDKHDTVISLFDRDCSLQRRHQKVIEEAPCSFLTPEIRKHMGEVAVKIANLINYDGAGTVEFILDIPTGQFYFLEVNARLQVEHPITEEITGLDLVALQIYVASGGRLRDLPVLADLSPRGHSIEARLCAEDPQRDFFPSLGRIALWRPASTTARYETAVRNGVSISIHFDPLIAKVVVWAPTRAMAIKSLVRELAGTACLGIITNQLFLQSCLLHPAFQRRDYSTSFIPKHIADLLRNPHLTQHSKPPTAFEVIPSLYFRQLKTQIKAAGSIHSQGSRGWLGFRNQRFDPVNLPFDIVTTLDGTDMPMATDPQMCIWVSIQGSTDSGVQELCLGPVPTSAQEASSGPNNGQVSPAVEVTARYNAVSRALRAGKMATGFRSHRVKIVRWQPLEGSPSLRSSWQTAELELIIDGYKVLSYVVVISDQETGDSTSNEPRQRILCHFPSIGTSMEYETRTMLSYCHDLRGAIAVPGAATEHLKTCKAPMPCKILSVLKTNGQAVKAGENVMVIESMKMEVNVSVAADGIFKTQWKTGDAVDEGRVLCFVE
jgi:acetyl/propionyl-CoA carboxylase alpha subunit